MIMELKAIGDLYIGDLILAYIDQYYYVPNNIWQGVK